MCASRQIKQGETVIRENLKHKATKRLVVEGVFSQWPIKPEKTVGGDISIKFPGFVRSHRDL